jgi:hypothetical protein
MESAKLVKNAVSILFFKLNCAKTIFYKTLLA